jgi:hypothetical protein
MRVYNDNTNKYDLEVYKFVKAYLKANEEEWLNNPQHF